jgi:leukotriene-A4 hydrolase
LTVDLQHKRIEGYAVLNCTAQKPTSTLVLDSRSLDIVVIHRAAADANATTPPPPDSAKLSFSLSEPHKALGEALTIEIGGELQAGQEARFGVHFRVTEGSTAAQFLAPAQTAGGKHPYLFTQCQAIHARSLVPCQVRFAWPPR